VDADRRATLKKCVISDPFWTQLALAVKYMQPVYEAIGRLEGDHPGLAVVNPIMKELKQHIKDVERNKDTPTNLRGVAKVFNARFDKHIKDVERNKDTPTNLRGVAKVFNARFDKHPACSQRIS
jgi:hypothetical protein